MTRLPFTKPRNLKLVHPFEGFGGSTTPAAPGGEIEIAIGTPEQPISVYFSCGRPHRNQTFVDILFQRHRPDQCAGGLHR
jgi:hypothetical protein